MPIKQAIILRGPNGVGKSMVREVIMRRRLNGGHSCGIAVLDEGWGRGEFRRAPAASVGRRYPDLVGRTEALLLVEIGLAEPENADDPKLLGTTRNPRAWVQLLATEGRQITLVRIAAEQSIIEARLADRHQRRGHPGPATQEELLQVRRIQDDDWPGPIYFSRRAGLREHEVIADDDDWERIADDVLSKLAHPLP